MTNQPLAKPLGVPQCKQPHPSSPDAGTDTSLPTLDPWEPPLPVPAYSCLPCSAHPFPALAPPVRVLPVCVLVLPAPACRFFPALQGSGDSRGWIWRSSGCPLGRIDCRAWPGSILGKEDAFKGILPLPMAHKMPFGHLHPRGFFLSAHTQWQLDGVPSDSPECHRRWLLSCSKLSPPKTLFVHAGSEQVPPPGIMCVTSRHIQWIISPPLPLISGKPDSFINTIPLFPAILHVLYN